MDRPLVWVPAPLVRDISKPLPVELEVILAAEAAPPWVTASAVAAVPVVPVTVRALILLLVGATAKALVPLKVKVLELVNTPDPVK